MSPIQPPTQRAIAGKETSAGSVIQNYIRSGAVAGALSAFVFAIVHHLFISDIWFSLPLMMIAGALCGLCLGWSFALLVEAPTAGRWLRYNLLYFAMFVLLGALSVLIYEPVTTIAALVEANAPPSELFGQAMPMTIVFTVATAALVSGLYRRGWLSYAAILLTCTLLVLLLGLNVAAIGLVNIPRGSAYLIVELFALILALNMVYVVAFIALERESLLA